jgi:glyoxylase-like metal-dependent hydrolase (beta-lactamase superfamily II)
VEKEREMAKTYVIYPIPLVEVEFPKPKMTHLLSFGESIPIVIYVWYLEGTEKKTIVDAGITAERLASRGYKVKPIQTLAEGLRKVGLTTADVETIILTHLHHDHYSQAREFPNAEVIVQRSELEFTRNPHPLFAAMWASDYRELLVGLRFKTVEGDTTFADGIDLLLTPGHSVGSQSVAVRTSKGKAIISGFCSIRENFEPPPQARRMPVVAPGILIDALKAYDSVVRVKELADIILPLHEADLADTVTIP